MKFSRIVIPADNVVSLQWLGDTLIDWVLGGKSFHLDGTHTEPRIHWAYRFDAAQSTPDGRFAVIYERLGTKALLLQDGRHLRELNRSYYHAHVYDYPICLWQAENGKTLIAHCPEDYCRIDIEEAESGVRLTDGKRKPDDFFHSRLMINRTGTRLLSAGWAWQPWDIVLGFDVAEALRNPAHLDDSKQGALDNTNLTAESSACWQTADRLLLGASMEQIDKKDGTQLTEPRLHPGGLVVYDLASQRYLRSVILGEPPGTMMPVGQSHAVCFYRHPKLVSLESGEIVMRWEDIHSGNQVSSISDEAEVPPLALDPEHQRFAVFGSKAITVIQIEGTDL